MRTPLEWIRDLFVSWQARRFDAEYDRGYSAASEILWETHNPDGTEAGYFLPPVLSESDDPFAQGARAAVQDYVSVIYEIREVKELTKRQAE